MNKQVSLFKCETCDVRKPKKNCRYIQKTVSLGVAGFGFNDAVAETKRILLMSGDCEETTLLDTNSAKPNFSLTIPKSGTSNFFINRELSWIRFNARVLEEARDCRHPLLERIKFLAICGSNLDEFFMTRIPRLLKQISKGSNELSVDGLSAVEQIQVSREEILPLIQRYADCWRNELLPFLTREGICIKPFAELSVQDKAVLRTFFQNNVLASISSPLKGAKVGSLNNLNINLLVLNVLKNTVFSIISVPTEKFGRLVKVPDDFAGKNAKTVDNYVFLEDLIANNLDLIFLNSTSLVAYPFRLTRNCELDILMNESSDFIDSIKNSLSQRKLGFPSRLEFDKKIPQEVKDKIALMLKLPDYLIYETDGPLGYVDFWQLLKINRQELKDKILTPYAPFVLSKRKHFFKNIAKHDVVLYHPYDSFDVIVNLLKEAAVDVDVLKIYITMYRVDAKSPVVNALMKAARNGKKVVAVIELKAKFDEENNLLLASKLKKAGVEIVYNFPKIKVHAKLCLIVRRENDNVVRYSHIGSGNYNVATAKIFGDIGYLTARYDVGLEIESLFDILKNGLQNNEFKFKYLLVAPKTLKHEILKRIDSEIAFHRKTGKGYLAFKLNNLEEPDVITALYRASMAGVKIDLNVRGLCCLKPGLKDVSENISVISIVGRFLEHARIFYFPTGTKSEILIGSSDLMSRNLNDRVEVLFNVPDLKIRQMILKNMLEIHLKDNVKARRLLSDGTYQMVVPKEGEEVVNSQLWFIKNRGIWHEYGI
ncbi:MAG: polyphosphate kinase 1 [Candidatus Bathyarchaeota archaeon]|nr:polyphosphate kinase 1 [Candidatus Termiticorpusculum sp.]